MLCYVSCHVSLPTADEDFDFLAARNVLCQKPKSVSVSIATSSSTPSRPLPPPSDWWGAAVHAMEVAVAIPKTDPEIYDPPPPKPVQDAEVAVSIPGKDITKVSVAASEVQLHKLLAHRGKRDRRHKLTRYLAFLINLGLFYACWYAYVEPNLHLEQTATYTAAVGYTAYTAACDVTFEKGDAATVSYKTKMGGFSVDFTHPDYGTFKNSMGCDGWPRGACAVGQ